MRRATNALRESIIAPRRPNLAHFADMSSIAQIAAAWIVRYMALPPLPAADRIALAAEFELTCQEIAAAVARENYVEMFDVMTRYQRVLAVVM